ncbi:MAG: toxic anion resistance protein, partial [Streptococcaceae bacterium]|nr:toxic anion resistance protein [Streptococcaceae bacterium]
MTEETKSVTGVEDLLKDPFSQGAVEGLPSVQQEELTVMKETNVAPRVFDKLDETEKKQAEQLASQIDISNPEAVLLYGSGAETKLSQFSSLMLSKVHKDDLGEIGDSLSDLMFNLQQSNPSELSSGEGNLFSKIFRKVKKSIFEITAKYQSIGAQIDKAAVKLDQDKNTLLENNKTLQTLYNQNLEFFMALNVFIAGAELKKEELAEKIIPASIQKAKESGEQMDAQIVQDQQQFLDRLDKRIYDLKLSRQISIQQAPQIRLIQNGNQTLAER